MINIVSDIDVENDLIVQLGHSIDKLLLHFLLCNINSIEESNYIAALRILMEPEISFAPESSPIIASAEKFKVDILLSGSKALQYMGASKDSADMAAIFGICCRRRKIVNGLLIGITKPGNSSGCRSLITLHHILCHVDLTLNTTLR